MILQESYNRIGRYVSTSGDRLLSQDIAAIGQALIALDGMYDLIERITPILQEAGDGLWDEDGDCVYCMQSKHKEHLANCTVIEAKAILATLDVQAIMEARKRHGTSR